MADSNEVIAGLQKVSGYFKSMLKVGYDGDADVYTKHRETVKKAIELLKKQRKTGHWIRPDRHSEAYCSECMCDAPIFINDWQYKETKTKYCPNCGAKMGR